MQGKYKKTRLLIYIYRVCLSCFCLSTVKDQLRNLFAETSYTLHTFAVKSGLRDAILEFWPVPERMIWAVVILTCRMIIRFVYIV